MRIEEECKKALRRGLALLPRAADLHHALGLLLVRDGDKAGALKELGAAVKLAPESARYAYVYAIGLHFAGKREAALAGLRAASARNPYDLDILGALVAMNREAGHPKAARPYARKLAEVLIEDPAVKRLLGELDDAD